MVDYSKWDRMDFSDSDNDDNDLGPRVTSLDEPGCQSLGWKPSEDGTKEGTELGAPRVASATSASTSTTNTPQINTNDADGALGELMEHVRAMDRDEAYRRMCMAQDEIRRLQSEMRAVEQQSPSQEEMFPRQVTPELSEEEEETAKVDRESKMIIASKAVDGSEIDGTKHNSGQGDVPSNNDAPLPVTGTAPGIRMLRASGSWLKKCGMCSIEFLPNVKCYSITLSAGKGADSSLTIPRSAGDLHCDIAPVLDGPSGSDRLLPKMQCFEVQLYRVENAPGANEGGNRIETAELLLSIRLMMAATTTDQRPAASIPSGRISLDTDSISIRIQLPQEVTSSMATDGLDLVDTLLGNDGCFSTTVTDVSELNNLSCRTCQNPIIGPDDASSEPSEVLRAALPLPSGCWDDIAGDLICYEGQPSIDFTSSNTNAIPRMALEDDAIVVLHREDLRKGGVCTLGAKVYGEHSHNQRKEEDENGYSNESTDWRDKSAVKGERPNAVTCANCCSTLGFVSDHTPDTFRLYKHLLDCGSASSSFSKKHTCGSFLAREMVRYADSEAIYTFIVGMSDEFDWARLHDEGPCILVRLLSWDTPMAVIDGATTNSSGESDTQQLEFQKVVKVIYEETSNKIDLFAVNSSDGSMEWTWGNHDFCCPPPARHANSPIENSNASSDDDDTSMGISLQKKASSTRIFFSKQEWSVLRDALARGSRYFSEVMKDALVMTKLGVSSSSQHNAFLSFLPMAT